MNIPVFTHSLKRSVMVMLVVIMQATVVHAKGEVKAPMRPSLSDSFLSSFDEAWSAYLSYHYALSSGDMGHALQLLARVKELDPSPNLVVEEAYVALFQGDWRKAQSIAEDIVETFPKNVEALLLLGKIYSGQGFHLRASEVLAAAVKAGKVPDGVYPMLIQEYLALGDVPAAKKTAEALIAQGDSEAAGVGYFYLGMIYDKHLNQSDHAQLAYEQALKARSHETFLLERLAELYLERKQTDLALLMYDRLRQLSPNDVNARLKMAIIYYEKGEKDKTRRLFEEIIHDMPDSDRVQYFLGALRVENHDYASARQILAKVSRTSSFYEDAQVEIIRAYMQEGKFSLAETLAKARAAEFSTEFRFYDLLASIHEKQGKLDLARNVLTSIATRFEGEWRYHAAYALFLDRQSDWQAAILEMRKVLALDPTNVSALNYIGYTYAEQGIRLSEARRLLDKAIALDPDSGFLHDSLGWVYFRMAKTKRARSFLERANRLSPHEPTILVHLGELYLVLKDNEQATRMFEEAVDLLKKKPLEQWTVDDRRSAHVLKERVKAVFPEPVP